MRRSLLLVAGVVLATPPAAQAAGTRTLDCERRSTGEFPNVYADEGSVVVGPLALSGLRRPEARTPEQVAATDGYVKSPLLLRPGRTATVRVDPGSRRFARLRYGGAEHRYTIRLKACDRRRSDSRAGSRRVTFWSGGFMVAQEPFCLRFTVTVDGAEHRRRLPVGGGAC